LLLAPAIGYAQINFEVSSLLANQSPPTQTFPLPSPLPAEVTPTETVPTETLPPPLAIGSPPSTQQGAPPAPLVGGPAVAPGDWLPWSSAPGLLYHLGGKARGYFINDHRIEFTGMESTFAAEGVIEAGCLQQVDGWQMSVESQFFLNEPFDKNMYVNTPERRSFTANFQPEAFQISQLYLAARRGDFYAAMGRFVTPFGRFYFPNFRNNFDDSPFIRSEAILFRETGLLLQWDPSIFTFTAAITNGGPEQDTNSSKAIVARVGIDQPNYALGTSVKWQDGIGSETQKVFNNHAGIDAMVRFGPWQLSAEAIYDQYGLRRPGTPLNSITWGRSLYYRDLNNGLNQPITGFGYYVNLAYAGPRWMVMLNYGEFYPEQIGNRRQDEVTRRGLIKLSRHWTPHFETYGVVFRENDLALAFDHSTRTGLYVLVGGQFTW
jgi:hypothetical protein